MPRGVRCGAVALKRAALVVIVAFAVLVPVGFASAAPHHAPIRLALVPLQTPQLGPAGASFALDYGSGPFHDGGIQLNFFGLHIDTPLGNCRHFPRGYALDYGDPLTGSTGVMEVRSAVQECRSRGDARHALFLWRVQDGSLTQFSSPLLPITVMKIKAAAPVGQQRFAELITLTAPNLDPIFSLDEQAAAGRFVLSLTITAGSVSAAERIAPHLMRVLRRRLNLMLQGRAIGSPATLPPEPTAGQAPGGPDLSTMVLQPSDFGESPPVNLFQASYLADPPALSTFWMQFAPAGTYLGVTQQLGWWPTALEATYSEAYDDALAASFVFPLDSGATVSPVDLSALDDPATGYLITGDHFGGSEVFVTLTNGQAGTFIRAVSDSILQASDVQSLALAAESRFDAGLGP